VTVVAAVVALVMALSWWSHMKRRHGLGPLLWRFLSGHALDGRFRTDASWLHRSTVTTHPTRVTRWHHMPRLHRAAIRDVSTVLLMVSAVSLARHRTATLETLALIALLGLMVAAWWVYRKLRHLRHYWQYVRPLSRRLTPMLEGAPPRLAIEPDRSEAKVYLPPEFVGTDGEWQKIETAVTVTLGLESPEREPQMQGNRPYVIYRKSVPPPPQVLPRHIRPSIEAAAEHVVILGIGKKDQVIDVSLDSESPHLGFCMTTGDGKSKAAMNVSVQVMWHGGLVVFLDYKLMSHMWARGLPNAAYAGTPSELHAMLCWLANDDEAESELTRRKQVALASADIRGNVTADIGPRILIVAEELNVTQKILKSYWRKIGGKGPSPAAEALDEVMFTGRQLRVHALQIGQRLSAKATSGSGSADSRENLGAIVFSNPSASTWKMLCDGHAQPPASDHKGRYQVVTRKQVREMQGALWDEEDARAFATAGTVAIPRHDMPFVNRRAVVPVSVTAGALPHGGSDQADVTVTPIPARPLGTVTLREAVEAGVFGHRSLAAVRKERARQPVFPAEVGKENNNDHLYDLSALAAYVTERNQ
jgi:hypothetical protein